MGKARPSKFIFFPLWLASLKKALGEGWLEVDRESVRLISRDEV
jgi:hypothetical protein